MSPAAASTSTIKMIAGATCPTGILAMMQLLLLDVSDSANLDFSEQKGKLYLMRKQELAPHAARFQAAPTPLSSLANCQPPVVPLRFSRHAFIKEVLQRLRSLSGNLGTNSAFFRLVNCLQTFCHPLILFPTSV